MLKYNINLLQLLSRKMSKLRHNFQEYSKIYYEDHIREHAKKEYKDALAVFERKDIDKKPHNLTILQDVTKTMFVEKSADVHEETKQFHI